MPPDFLSIIVDRQKETVAASQRRLPLPDLQKEIDPNREKRPFAQRLRDSSTEPHIIAEIKRSSPSKGDIRPDLDPAMYARQYEAGGATAISVLTESAHFKGSLEDFRIARAANSLPMLRKDFLISPYQFYESAALEADAVLLIARILEAQQLRDYLLLCRELNLDGLVEIHSQEDLEKANHAGADLIGINNRNLSSFDTNIGTAMRLSSRLSPNQLPVAASGIHTRKDITENLSRGITNFLVGESLVRAEDPAEFIRHLRGKSKG